MSLLDWFIIGGLATLHDAWLGLVADAQELLLFINRLRFLQFADDDDDEEGGDEEKMPTCGDYVLHFLTLFWKILFAFVPPTGTVLWPFF